MPIDAAKKAANRQLFDALEHCSPWRERDRDIQIKAALAAGADPNARSLRKTGGVGGRPLHAAAQYAGEEQTRLLLEAGADPNKPRTDKSTPLHIAAASRSDQAVAVIELLAKAGAGISAVDENGKTPLANALSRGLIKTAKKLVDLGASWSELPSDPAPLFQAIERLDADTVAFMLDHGAPLDHPDGRSPLLALMKSKSFLYSQMEPNPDLPEFNEGLKKSVEREELRALAVLERLLKAGLDPKGEHAWIQQHGAMGLMCAALLSKAPTGLLLRLQEEGCEVAKARSVESWLGGVGSLASRGDPKILARAFEFGLDPHWVDSKGRGLVYYAISSRYESMDETLGLALAKGADPNARDDFNVPPLFYAARHECSAEKLTRALLDAGADPNATVGELKIPLTAALLVPDSLGRHWADRAEFRGGNHYNMPGSRVLISAADPNAIIPGISAPLLAIAPQWSREHLIAAGADTRAAADHLARSKDPRDLYSRFQIDDWVRVGMPVEHLIEAYPAALERCLAPMRTQLEGSGVLSYMEALALKRALRAPEPAKPPEEPAATKAPSLRI